MSLQGQITIIRKRNTGKLEKRQEEVFTNWCNYILLPKQLRINSIVHDLDDGIILILLAGMLTGKPIKRFNKRPRLAAQQINNISIALNHLKTEGIRLNVSASDIRSGDAKVVLGLFWALIKKYQLDDSKITNNMEASLDLIEMQISKKENVAPKDPFQIAQDLCQQLGDFVKQNTAKIISSTDAVLKATSEAQVREIQESFESENQTILSSAEEYKKQIKSKIKELGPEFASDIENVKKIKDLFDEVDQNIEQLQNCIDNREKAAQDRIVDLISAQCIEWLDDKQSKFTQEHQATMEEEHADDLWAKIAENHEKQIESVVANTLSALSVAGASEETKQKITQKKQDTLSALADLASGGKLKNWMIDQSRNVKQDYLRQESQPSDLRKKFSVTQTEILDKLNASKSTIADSQELQKYAADLEQLLKDVDAVIAAKEDLENHIKQFEAWTTEQIASLTGKNNDSLNAIAQEVDKKEKILNDLISNIETLDDAAGGLGILDRQQKRVSDSAEKLRDALNKEKQKLKENDTKDNKEESKRMKQKWERRSKAFKNWVMDCIDELDDQCDDLKDADTVESVSEIRREHEKVTKEEGSDMLDQRTKHMDVLTELWNNGMAGLPDVEKSALRITMEDVKKMSCELEEAIKKRDEAFKAKKQSLLDAKKAATDEELAKAKAEEEVVAARKKAEEEEAARLKKAEEEAARKKREEEAAQEAKEAARKEKEAARKEEEAARKKKSKDNARKRSKGSKKESKESSSSIRKGSKTESGHKKRSRNGRHHTIMSASSGEFCDACHKTIPTDLESVKVGKKRFHDACYACCICGAPFEKYYWHYHDRPYCEEHYKEVTKKKCGVCGKAGSERTVSAAGRYWHKACLKCSSCLKPLLTSSLHVYSGKPYCEEHYHLQKGMSCAKCGKGVTKQDKLALDKYWHSKCFVCWNCDSDFGSHGFFDESGYPFCRKCRKQAFEKRMASRNSTSKARSKIERKPRRGTAVPLSRAQTHNEPLPRQQNARKGLLLGAQRRNN